MFPLLVRVKFLQRLISAPTSSSRKQNDADVSCSTSIIAKGIILRLDTKVHSVAIFVNFSNFSSLSLFWPHFKNSLLEKYKECFTYNPGKKKSLWIKSIYPSEPKSLCPQNIMHSNKHQKSHKCCPGAYNNLCDNFELIYFVIYSLKWKLAQFSLTSSAFTSQKPSALSLSVQPSPAQPWDQNSSQGLFHGWRILAKQCGKTCTSTAFHTLSHCS